MRPPNNPTPTGLHPVTLLGFGPRFDYLFPASLRSGRKQIEPRGENTVQGMNEGLLSITHYDKSCTT